MFEVLWDDARASATNGHAEAKLRPKDEAFTGLWANRKIGNLGAKGNFLDIIEWMLRAWS